MELITIAWAWACANPEATGAAVYGLAEIAMRLLKTKDSAGLLKRLGAGIDLILDVVRVPNRLK